MEISNIRSISAKFIFFMDENNNQDSKPCHKKELLEIFEKLNEEYTFYQRMYTELRDKSERMEIEINKLSERIENLKERIEDNQDNLSVRRGLADVCFEYESAKQDYAKRCYETIGVHEITSEILDKVQRRYELMTQVKNAIHLCKK